MSGFFETLSTKLIQLKDSKERVNFITINHKVSRFVFFDRIRIVYFADKTRTNFHFDAIRSRICSGCDRMETPDDTCECCRGPKMDDNCQTYLETVSEDVENFDKTKLEKGLINLFKKMSKCRYCFHCDKLLTKELDYTEIHGGSVCCWSCSLKHHRAVHSFEQMIGLEKDEDDDENDD